MPYGRYAVYAVSGDAQEVTEKARSSLLPIFQRQPGFTSYGVITQDEKIFSMSA